MTLPPRLVTGAGLALAAVLALAVTAFLARQGGLSHARREAQAREDRIAAETATLQARVATLDKAISDAAARDRVVIIRETRNAVDDILQAPLGPDLAVGDLRELRDRVERLRNETDARRAQFLAGGSPAGTLHAAGASRRP